MKQFYLDLAGFLTTLFLGRSDSFKIPLFIRYLKPNGNFGYQKRVLTLLDRGRSSGIFQSVLSYLDAFQRWNPSSFFQIYR